MKKRVFMALLMALTFVVLPFGEASMRVSAEEGDQQTAAVSVSGGDAEDGTAGDTEGSTENPTAVQLPAPTNLAWDDNFNPTFNGVAGSKGHYGLEVYKDNEEFFTTSWSVGIEEGPIDLSFSKEVNEAGTYKFRVRSKAAYDDPAHADSEWSEWSAEKVYVRPAQALGTTVGYWDTQIAGLFHYNGVEGASGYYVQLYKQGNEGDWGRHSSFWSVGNWTDTAGNIHNEDFADEISIEGEGKYCVTVTALSNNISAVANGPEGAKSEILDTSVNADKLNGVLTEAMKSGNAETALNTLTGSVDDISAIQQAMQTSDTFLGSVKELEEKYKDQKGITVGQNVSPAAAQYVDSSKISMVGAAFNAKGSGVNLDVDVTPEENKVPLEANYLNSVQLDIKLDSGDTSVSELVMPITITMPVPQGINAAQLVILHYHKDGAKEKVAFKNNGDGTVTFTVKSFSTFVFAEGRGNSGTDGDNVITEDGSGNISSSTDSGSGSNYLESIEARIDAAVPGAVVKISRAENINTLANSIMQKLVKRNDVTLLLECTYEGVDYTITIPAGKAIDNDIPWYGPLYLVAHYGNGAPAAAGVSGSVYTVKAKDTLWKIASENGMTVAQLAAKNPQIKNIDMIHIGQVIHLQ